MAKKRPPEFWQIGPWGREMLEYLENTQPQTVRQMTQDGNLWEYLSREDDRLDEMMLELTQRQKLPENQAREIVRAEFQT